MLEPQSHELLWIIIVGFIIAFFLAFGVGANDVANSFGTSVGSKVLTLRQACILATIFEILGAVLMGYKVSDTVRKDIFDVNMFANNEKELMLGNLAALAGSAIWNIIATFFRLPISGTHSIVGAVVGFTLVSRGFYGVQWRSIGMIVASWFLSPVLSGIFSTAIFLGIQFFILKKSDQLEPGLKSLPFFYGFTILINIFSIVHDGPSMLKFDQVPWWGVLILSVGLGFITGLSVYCFLVPYQRKTITAFLKSTKEGVLNKGANTNETSIEVETVQVNFSIGNDTSVNISSNNDQKCNENSISDKEKKNKLEIPKSLPKHIETSFHNSNSLQALVPEDCNRSPSVEKTEENKESDENKNSLDDRPETFKIFSYLQILTAVFGSFAHGGNDVSNAIGPLIAMWMIFLDGNVYQGGEAPFYILLYGGLGITVGLWVWGQKVIKTLGEDLTKITPSSGFTIEIGAASTVLLASKLGLPISTTHCKVGSVVFVGWTRSRQGVDWSLFRNIVLAWILTLPITGGIAAILMAIFNATLV
ncbi:sodium-dependent phosphate transporter 1-B-like [Centruroides vittatus]|uniref:sodium-dependent phosphate transporter 1-B-like n=1 Tax=Centruroides vittatus TaxID=120091 RepID=UPI00350FDF26